MIRRLKDLFAADLAIKADRRRKQWTQTRNITILTILSFLVMSLLNFFQHSVFMLFTTLGSAAGLLACLVSSWKAQRTETLENGYFVLLLLLFTYYILAGGNDGFAVLWVIFVPFMFMTMIDLKRGLILSLYFLILLFLVFYGPLQCLLRYDYPEMIRLRFPVLYLIDFALSFYSVRELLLARAGLIHAQEQIRKSSFLDAATGLKNRAAYMNYVNSASSRRFIRLTAIYIDVNGLHELNNRLGHAAGDEMLRFVANACAEQFPHADIFRLGGDEFLLLCPVGAEGEIQKWMEQLNQTIEAAGYTIAYGIEYRLSDFDIEAMVNCADAKMLRNKAEYYKARDRRGR